MPPLNHHVRLYCERTSAELWGEPFNTLSSLGFLIAAWMLWHIYRDYRRQVGPTPEIPILIAIVALIGIGSALFHSVATKGMVLFDVIPIAFFVFFYLYVFSRLLLGFGYLGSAGLFVALAVANIAFKYYYPYRAIDGYISYIPTFLFLVVLAGFMWFKRHDSALRVFFAAGLAFISLFFRTADREVCSYFPFGTHFLWHLMNAWLIYILVRELMWFRMPENRNT
jgi:hypothetical protein